MIEGSWTWKTAKLKDTEAAEILLLIQGKTDAVAFYHTFRDDTTRVSIARKEETTFFRIEDLAKALTPPELEVLRIILTETIRRAVTQGSSF
jgi:DNA transposition AAA+ family ATPase